MWKRFHQRYQEKLDTISCLFLKMDSSGIKQQPIKETYDYFVAWAPTRLKGFAFFYPFKIEGKDMPSDCAAT